LFFSFVVGILDYNRYAAVGRWNDRQKLRDEMAKQDIQKIPGLSQIEVNGQIHKFVMRDDSHPELGAIHKTAQQMDQAYPLFIILPHYFFYFMKS
jgi:hypothetical protein